MSDAQQPMIAVNMSEYYERAASRVSIEKTYRQCTRCNGYGRKWLDDYGIWITCNWCGGSRGRWVVIVKAGGE
jgi:hypothetical protein